MEINLLLELTAYAKPYRVDAMNSLEWIELDQKLEYSRCSHMAFIIDDDLTISHKNYFHEYEQHVFQREDFQCSFGLLLNIMMYFFN